MKPTLPQAIADVYSLKPNSDYSRFMPSGGALGMMRDRWRAIGQRLEQAAVNVERDARGAPKKASK